MESAEMRSNAWRWPELAVEAAKEGGFSEANLKGFMQEVWRIFTTRKMVHNGRFVFCALENVE